jgi:predicted dehydrogenase
MGNWKKIGAITLSNKKLKVGIAGYGVVGKRRKDCVDKHPFLEMHSICDQKFSKNEKIVDGLKCFESYKSLLGEELDILFVCLTNEIAPEVTIAALQAGFHVFCEKPPGRNVSEIQKVIKVEKKFSNLKLMYGFNHRYHESILEAFRIIKTKELGSIINLRGVYGKSQLITFNQKDWRTDRKVAGGGVLLDQGIHMVDLMRLFAGEFEQVYSFISNSHWNFDVEDNAYAIMKAKSGTVAMINSSATQWRHRFHLDINLEKGSLILEGILSGSKSYGAETLTVVKADPEFDNGDPVEQVFRYNNDPSWSAEVNEFVSCIQQNRDITSSSSLDALNTMKLVYKIYYSDPKWREKYKIPKPRN